MVTGVEFLVAIGLVIVFTEILATIYEIYYDLMKKEGNLW